KKKLLQATGVSVIGLLCSTALGAPSTRTVDGVGAGAGEFVTISAALADLAGSADNGDSDKDTINVTATISETGNLAINHSVLLDELEIVGNGNTVIFAASAVVGGVVM